MIYLILFVGKKIRFGQLVEVVENRIHDEVRYVEENDDIFKQENSILLACDTPKFVVYDTQQYLNDAVDIIEIIKRIYRTNKAKPILLVPTSNPNNEIVKNAVDGQIKLFVNTSASMSEQKDQFEKDIAGFYEENENEEIEAAKKVVSEENNNLKDYVQSLHDAKAREEEKENTVIVKKKGTAEVLLNASSKAFKTFIGIIVFILAAIGILTLTYDNVRAEFFQVALNVYNEILGMM